MSVTILGREYDIETTIRLDLSYVKLTTLPIEICSLIKLEILLLDFNNLTTLPKEIGNLVNLEILFLSNNNITSLPTEINQLVKLKTLSLCNNKLFHVPIEIYSITSLTQLFLNNNNLTTLPIEICNLINLNKLYLYCNCLTNLPKKILTIKDRLVIYDNSYDIDNLKIDCEMIILTNFFRDLTNLPTTLKEIYLEKSLEKKLQKFTIRLPYGCEIKLFP